MAEENTAGASYLASLKQSPTASTSGTGADRASEAAAYPDFATETHATTPQPKPIFAEKRRSPPYRWQGSAHLREMRTGVSTWATFTDISLHGVYVEAMSTYRVGARLALTLEVNGFRIETRAEVRVIYPGLGMGICFLAMPEDEQQKVRELLRSLSQSSPILSPKASSPMELSLALSTVTVADPRAALQSIIDFFEQRHILSRDEFLRILKKGQNSGY